VGFTVAEELLLNGKSSLLSSASVLMDDVLEIDGEHAKAP
jgi:hypothetical protein